MGNIDLKEYFTQYAYKKLEVELKAYKQKMYQLSAKEVFDHAYEIDSYINIYEILLTKIEYFTPAQLWGIVVVPNILSFFYEHWLDVEDSRAEEMESAIDEITKTEFGTKQKLVC